MQFVNPLFLFGLFAIAIPVVVHLFNFRRYKKVYFSNVAFLKGFRKRTQKQSELLRYLVLAMRILAIAALVFTFAQPYIPAEKTSSVQAKKMVSVFVDNSFSMESAGADGRLLDEALRKAREIAMAYSPDDLFQLLTNDFEGKHQRMVARDEFLLMLREIKPGAAHKTLKEILQRQNDLLKDKQYKGASAYIISDFQKSTLLGQLPDSISGFPVNLVPVDEVSVSNIYVDSCWFENPVLRLNQTAVLKVRITNISENNLEKIPVKLTIDGIQRAITSVDIRANTSQTAELSFRTTTAGSQKAVVEVGDYPVIFDDNFYMAIKVTESIPVLVINQTDADPYLQTVFALDSVVQPTQLPLKQTNFNALGDYTFVILNGVNDLSSGAAQQLNSFVGDGGTLLVFPPASGKADVLNQLLSQLGSPVYQGIDTTPARVTGINMQHDLFKGVFNESTLPGNTDYPLAVKHYKIAENTSVFSDHALKLVNGSAFLTKVSGGGGHVVLSAVPADDRWSNFQRHALFVPAILNAAFQSVQILPATYFINSPDIILSATSKPQGDQVLKMTREDGSGEFIPGMRSVNGQIVLNTAENIADAGFYNLKSGDKIIDYLAFNYSRKESDLRRMSLEELKKMAGEISGFTVLAEGKKEIGQLIAERNNGLKLWKWFLIAALVFMLAEVLLLRFFRRQEKAG